MTDNLDELDLDTGGDASFGGGTMHVESFMGSDVVTAPPSTTLRAAAALLDEAGYGILVVGTREHVEGVVSERDILRAVASGTDLDSTTIDQFESRQLRWATPESTVDDVVEEMMEGYIRHVLVAGPDGALLGMVSMRDLLAAFLD